MPQASGRKVKGKCRSLSGCLFTTAFLFCFGLYALYKYTLIDVDSVLRNGDGQAFDYGDYGIDVSALRSIKTFRGEDGNPMSKVDQWDALVQKENGVRMAYVTDNCGNFYANPPSLNKWIDVMTLG